MDRFDVEWELRTSLEHAVPDVKDEILKRCAEEHSLDESVVPMILERRPQKKNRYWQSMVAAAAVILLLLNVGSVMFKDRTEHRVETIIGLDVNPSIELAINAQDRVITADALNSDAYYVLEGMELSGAATDVAVNAILGSMYKLGYLDENSNSILVSVDNRNETVSQEIETRLVENINETLQSYSVEAAILSQTVTGTEIPAVQTAEDCEMSQGRRILIQKIIDNNPVYTFEDLSQLTINELNLLLNSQRVEVQTVTTTGVASEKSYIGQEAAVDIVMAKFGGDSEQLTDLYADIDVMNGRMVYGVTYLYGGVIYGYEVDALTGEIIADYVDYPIIEVSPTTDITGATEGEVATEAENHSQEVLETSSGSVSDNQTITDENGAQPTDNDAEEPAEDNVSGNTVSDNSPAEDASEDAEAEEEEEEEEEETASDEDGDEKESLEGKYSAVFMKRSGVPRDAKLLWKEDLKNDNDYGKYDEEWISGSEARTICISHAQVSRNEVTYTYAAVYERKDSVYFILEFETRTAAYQYILDVMTGDIVEYEKRQYEGS